MQRNRIPSRKGKHMLPENRTESSFLDFGKFIYWISPGSLYDKGYIRWKNMNGSIVMKVCTRHINWREEGNRTPER